MKITEIWFSGDQIFGRDEKGQVYSQSLLWYPRLKAASPEEREKYASHKTEDNSTVLQGFLRLFFGCSSLFSEEQPKNKHTISCEISN